MEQYSDTTKFAFTCNDSSKIIEGIQSRCIILQYQPMEKDKITFQKKYSMETKLFNLFKTLRL